MSHGSSFGGQNWEDKCREILQKVLDSLGIEQQWFDRPVDEYYIPGLVPTTLIAAAWIRAIGKDRTD